MGANRRQALTGRTLSDADVARALVPHAAVLVPILIEALDRATDAMIADGELPVRAIEALDDFGNFLSRAAAEMFAARVKENA